MNNARKITKKMGSLVLVSLLVMNIVISAVALTMYFYTITYDSNGGTPVSSTRHGSTDYGSGTRFSILKLADAPTRKGYTFTGWYLDKECTKPLDMDARFNKDTTLHAGWRADAASKTPTSDSSAGQTKKPNAKAVPKSRVLKKKTKITLKAPKNTTLYYTTNGKKPKKSASKKVNPGKSKRLTIKKTVTLRVMAIKKGCTASKIIKRTYIVRK
ncbi:MAG: InlB B-repeat-containing protein [Oscillospiraceae bacterium]|nr:InlB B-repeat-containing protein [Oscillospiraceae bacterium]